jgi:carotenoid cleavage dioxygenase-like enzyme
VYAALGEPGLFLFRGFVKTDTKTGARTTFELPKGVFASEAPFCPRLGSTTTATDEDDGYLVTFTIDVSGDASECLLMDARQLDRGPIARIRLPMRISSGTHATWGNLVT